MPVITSGPRTKGQLIQTADKHDRDQRVVEVNEVPLDQQVCQNPDCGRIFEHDTHKKYCSAECRTPKPCKNPNCKTGRMATSGRFYCSKECKLEAGYSKRREQAVSNPRMKEMIMLFKLGVTLKEIGERYGITKERVRQLLKRAGYVRREASTK